MNVVILGAGTVAGIMLMMLFDTGRNREIAIFLASFGIPAIPIGLVYGSVALANQIIDRKRRSKDFSQYHEQMTFGLIVLGGLIVGTLGSAGCLYVLYASLVERASG